MDLVHGEELFTRPFAAAWCILKKIKKIKTRWFCDQQKIDKKIISEKK
jgi:hypothetical protein